MPGLRTSGLPEASMSLSPLRTLVLACGVAATASACVTINIYFPAAAAEKAADRIIDEVWQLRGASSPAPPSNSLPDVPPSAPHSPSEKGAEQ